MAQNLHGDLIENPSPRCPCLLVVDTSGSMYGEPIEQLNQGVQQFIQALQEDEIASYSVEVGILAAGGHVEEIIPFTTAEQLDYTSTFTAQGSTPLGSAVEQGLKMLEDRKREYQKTALPTINLGWWSSATVLRPTVGRMRPKKPEPWQKIGNWFR